LPDQLDKIGLIVEAVNKVLGNHAPIVEQARTIREAELLPALPASRIIASR
jgi:hypothetical protein